MISKLDLNSCFQIAVIPDQGQLGKFWHKPAIEAAKEVAGYRHACRLRFDWFDWRKGVILGVSAEISQISDAPGLDGFANLFLYLLE